MNQRLTRGRGVMIVGTGALPRQEGQRARPCLGIYWQDRFFGSRLLAGSGERRAVRNSGGGAKQSREICQAIYLRGTSRRGHRGRYGRRTRRRLQLQHRNRTTVESLLQELRLGLHGLEITLHRRTSGNQSRLWLSRATLLATTRGSTRLSEPFYSHPPRQRSPTSSLKFCS